jgi:plasmid maintenance system antidote protein VapI
MFRDANDKNFEALVAENRFVSDIQLVIERALEEVGMSQVDLARALDISEARISQIVGGNGKNLQARTVARIAHVLNLRPCLDFMSHAAYQHACDLNRGRSRIDFKKWLKVLRPADERSWNQIANDDECELAGVA